MNGKLQCAFVDTNIFVYALDELETTKSPIALSLIMQLHSSHRLTVSNQVVRDYFNVFCKPDRGLSGRDYSLFAEHILEPSCRGVEDYEFIIKSLGLRDLYGVSFYDALILQAAMDAGCSTLYSEDFQHDRMYGSVRVINPFI
jgi:predicted nucleic acid-binding protein